MLLDLRPDMLMADFFVVCTGNSDRQLKALSQYVRDGVKGQFNIVPYSAEGVAESGWILMDYGDVVAHLFLDNMRQFYDLEGLWSAESTVLLSIQ